LLISTSTVSGSTTAPGLTSTRSTRASLAAAIQRTSRGTSTPGPRTCRSISPRSTVSMYSDARSTEGAAGSSLATRMPSAAKTVTPAAE
jgi:hypothetical protein